MTTTTAHHLPSESAPTFELPGIEFTAFASPSRHSQQLCTWQITVDAGLVSPTAHTLDRDEVFMVTDGTISIGEGLAHAGPGDTVVVPAGQPIRLSNPGDTPATAFVVVSSGFTVTAEDGTPIPTPPWAE
jgi:mannose-6-phosphate isomerase-like protein (cupin superfamily)